MNLSHKLTFSLTSIILLMAFAVVPAMAHDIITSGDGHEDDAHTAGDNLTDTTTDPATVHPTHPVLEKIELLNGAADGYVGNGESFEIKITFSGAAPINLALANIGIPSGWLKADLRANTTKLVYTARVTTALTGTADDVIRIPSSALTVRVADPTNDNGWREAVIFDPDPVDSNALTTAEKMRRPAIILDNAAPELVTTGVNAPEISGERSIADLQADQWSGGFTINFTITNATGATPDLSLDFSKITFKADPNVFTFEPAKSVSGDNFSVKVTPKPKTTQGDETEKTEVTITISVGDKAGNTAMATIDVNLAPRESTYVPNAAPTKVGKIAAQTLTAGAAATTINVASKFSDTDALTYTATSSDKATATVAVEGSVVSITPVAAGTSTITVTATDTASQTATQEIAVTVKTVSLNPKVPVNISSPIMIPANSYVVVVRNMNDDIAKAAAIKFPDVDAKAVMIKEWTEMPDLEALFNRSSFGNGGALVLRKSADAEDNDNADGTGTNATPALGSVGISEIMWGLDLGQVNRDDWGAGQWIELHNLNSKPVNVLLYAQTARELVSNKLIGNTAAGDSIIGALGGSVIDVVQNIHENGDRTKAGWNLKGKSGNSITGEDIVGMHRILPDKQAAYTAVQNYTKRDGRSSGSWAEASNVYARRESSRTNNNVTTVVVADYKGTPGNRNDFKNIDLLKPDGRTGVPANRIVFNEVANRSNANKAYEWIELKNVSSGNINLKNYKISVVTAVGTETLLIDFGGGDLNVPAGGLLLLLDTNPLYNRNHPIQIGKDENGVLLPHKVIDFKGDGLPDGGNFVLILRGKGDNKGVGISGSGKDKGNANDILDIAGYHSDLKTGYGYTNAVSKTDLWPLKSFEAPASDKNRFDTETVHYRQIIKSDTGKSGVGTDHGDKKDHQVAFRGQGYTGVGYKRLSEKIPANGGTPGFPNGNYHSSGDTVKSSVYISEIMYADNKAGVLPQWIELRNTSKSVGVDLHNVRLTITNHADIDDAGTAWKGKGEGSTLLRDMRIKPNSAVLIASRRAVQRLDVSTVHMPSTDIFILWDKARKTFGGTANADVINSYGFKITLHANGHESDRNKWQLIDEVGNLDSAAKDNRGRSDERFADPLWNWPAAITEDGHRISVVRVAWEGQDGVTDYYKGTVRPTSGKGKVLAWQLSTEDPGHGRVAAITYYGDIDDISSPGLTHGQALPVTLSHFRPTLEDGKVTIRWTTESELDNAGFNILRSETRNGEFTKVNEQMIQGNGTTAERSTYKWVDTTAKPGAIYYYQIEDVSFAGEHTTLTTTKLKGLISAKGKLTTQWGDLKNLR